jgi:TIR domain
MKVLVSYPSSMSWIIHQIFNHLPSEAVEGWIDDQKISFGSSIEEKVTESIENADYIVSFLNEEALNSKWVQKELELAFKREDVLGRRFVLPVLLDFPKDSLPARLQDSRRFLTYQGGDYIRSIAAFANELTDELFRLVCERIAAVISSVSSSLSSERCEMRPNSGWNGRTKTVRPSTRFRSGCGCFFLILWMTTWTKSESGSALRRGRYGTGRSGFLNVSHRTAPNLEASESTTLYDVPNILTSAAKLYGYSRHNERQRRRPEWIHQTKLELSAFKIRFEAISSGCYRPGAASRMREGLARRQGETHVFQRLTRTASCILRRCLRPRRFTVRPQLGLLLPMPYPSLGHCCTYRRTDGHSARPSGASLSPQPRYLRRPCYSGRPRYSRHSRRALHCREQQAAKEAGAVSPVPVMVEKP